VSVPTGAGDVAVVLLTFNEALHIERALTSVQPFARETFVIDSFSTDGTPDIARRMGATVLQNPWVNYAKQFTWGLENAPITAPWVMRLDCDEIVLPELAQEIVERLPTLGQEVAGVNIDRRHIFMGRWIRHGGRFPLTLLRLWRRGQGRIEDRWMDEHIVVEGGRTIKFEGHLADCNLKDLTFFTAKHNGYATREAIDVLIDRHQLFEQDRALTSATASRQAAGRRMIKEKIYNRMPFWLNSFAYFLYRYIIQLGFLDGRAGLIYHVLQGFWYRFLVGAKIEEFEQALASVDTRSERVAVLERISGHRLIAAEGNRG
jgi:glycosyltransferase involved in cell wall biosynthesis